MSRPPSKRGRLSVKNVILEKTAFCHVHNKECSLEDPADLNVSGLPCQDNSRANLNRLFFVDGKHGSVYLGVGTKTPVSQNAVIDS